MAAALHARLHAAAGPGSPRACAHVLHPWPAQLCVPANSYRSVYLWRLQESRTIVHCVSCGSHVYPVGDLLQRSLKTICGVGIHGCKNASSVEVGLELSIFRRCSLRLFCKTVITSKMSFQQPTIYPISIIDTGTCKTPITILPSQAVSPVDGRFCVHSHSRLQC